MRITVVRVGPKQAREMLLSQRHNRRRRRALITELAGAMARGEWKMNGETLKQDRYGRLLDGQHRLWAVIEADVTLDFILVRGVPADAYDTMDTGRHRTLIDTLQTQGKKNTAVLAALLTSVYRIRTNSLRRFPGGVRPTQQQLLGLYSDEPEIETFVHKARTVWESVPLSTSLAGAFWYELGRIDAVAADSFFEGLIHGTGLAPDDSVRVFRRFLEGQRHPPRRMPRDHVAGLLIKAWNAHVTGARVNELTFRSRGPNAEPFPAIYGGQAIAKAA